MKTLKEKCDTVLRVWISNSDPEGEYKLTGGYWEVLYPLLKKHSPELLRMYENFVGEFDYFNEEVRNHLSTGDEEKDFINAIGYMNARERMYATPMDRHAIDLGDDRIIYYIPNQSLDEDVFD